MQKVQEAGSILRMDFALLDARRSLGISCNWLGRTEVDWGGLGRTEIDWNELGWVDWDQLGWTEINWGGLGQTGVDWEGAET